MTRADLERRGFCRWIPLLTADSVIDVPSSAGVYAVSYSSLRPSHWPKVSCGGWHKQRNPTVPVVRLVDEWVDGTDIVYIGKTDRTLAKRITELARFGQGKPVAHWGGRLVWQLPDVRKLQIGWRVSDTGDATQEEALLLSEFINVFGRLPFANLRK